MITKLKLFTLALIASIAMQAQPTTEIKKLLDSDGAEIDLFGAGVSISGDVAIVSAWGDNDFTGSAYIYYNDGGTWVKQAKLTASDAVIGDRFGVSVSISGDVAILGAWGDDSFKGSAYIFEKPSGGWADMTQTAKLTASDAAADDEFGISISISGDVAVVGAISDDDNGSSSGSAYVFEKPAGGWENMTQTAKLTASDAAILDRFGGSVSISGDVAIVGATWDDDNGSESGSAYIFEKPAGGWENMTQTAKLTASDGADYDVFGESVSISGDVVIVGNVLDDDDGSNSGSAYIFEKPAGGWADMTQTAKLTASDADMDDYFGSTVCISGDVVIVGARYNDDNGSESGSAYIFEKPAGGWANMTHTTKLIASDGTAGDEFGYSVGISGDLAIVGAVRDDENGYKSGSAYIFGPEPVCDDFRVSLKNSYGTPVTGGSLEYREGGGNPWQVATEISSGVFCIDTERNQLGLRMTYGPQVSKVSEVPTNTDYTYQMEEVTVKLREGGVLTDNGEVHYTSNGWHYIGVTGDNGTGLVKFDMLPNTYTFRMNYYGDKEQKQRVISPTYNKITFHVEDLKSALVDGNNEFQLAAYPNPFNGNATIAFSLEEAQEVNISVYDQTGRLIEVLQNGIQSKGNHKINWDASDVNKGVYFVRLSSAGRIVHQNVVKM